MGHLFDDLYRFFILLRATIEVADELAAHYPQVIALRHARPMGSEAAVRTGLRRSTGQIVLLKDGDGLRRIDRRAAVPIRRPTVLGAERNEPSRGSPGGARRPKYLAGLREFTLGE